MTEIVIRAARHFGAQIDLKKIFLLLLIFGAALPNFFQSELIELIADAFYSVSIYVAATLTLIYGLETLFRFDLAAFNAARPRLQVYVSSLLGALPGCGGAIVVVTQYSQGHVSFGSVIAALTATMGDAAFLLLAAQPKVAIAIIIMSITVGIITGRLVDSFHGRDFMKVDPKNLPKAHEKTESSNFITTMAPLWFTLVVIGFSFSLLETTLVAQGYEQLMTYFAVVVTLFMLWQWSMQGPQARQADQWQASIINDTNFITGWVVLAFVAYGLTVNVFDIDLRTLFQAHLLYLPLIAILVGFIPGCGPQIIVTTLYINGIIPLSAQIGNAISNDGDALFPALAIAPKASILATLYSAIPALIIAYGYMFLFEL